MDDIFDLDLENLPQIPSDSEVIEAIPTTEPYWNIPVEPLLHFLALAAQFGWKSGRDLTSKSVSLTFDGTDKILCRATDFDTYLEYSIKVQSERPINGTVIFQTTSLVKLIKLCSKQFVLAKDTTPKVLILGQWIPVEELTLAPTLFCNSDPVEELHPLTIPTLTDILPITSSAVVPKDRNLLFSENTVQSTLLWSTIQRKGVQTPIPFMLSSREALLLKSLQGSLSIAKTRSDLPRILIQSESIKLWFIHREPDQEITSFPSPQFTVSISASSLTKLTTIAETLPTSTGFLQFNFNQSLTITYQSRLGNTQFPIDAQVNGEPTQLSDVLIQTKILSKVLSPLGKGTITLSWNTASLFLESDSAQVILSFEE